MHIQRLFKHNKFLLPVVIVLFLTFATALTIIVSKKTTDNRSKALADTAQLSFSQTSVDAAVNSQFSVDVVLNTNGQAVVGSDILVEFDKTKLQLLSVSNPVNNIFKTYLPIVDNSQGVFDSATVISNANQNGVVEMGIAAFDYAANAGSGDITGTFTGTLSPVTTLSFKVLSTGSSIIKYRFDNTLATTDSNVIANDPVNGAEDVLAVPTSQVTVTTTVAGGPSPSIAPTPGMCNQNCNLDPIIQMPCSSGYVCVISGNTTSGICRNSACTSDTDCVCSTTASPSPSSSPTSGVLTIKFKFQGVSSQEANSRTWYPQQVEYQGKQVVSLLPTPQTVGFGGVATATPDSFGNYTMDITLASSAAQNGQVVIVGPSHLAKRVSFDASSQVIDLTTSDLDELLPGDVYSTIIPHNNKVDLVDYSLLVHDYGSKYPGFPPGSSADFDVDHDVDIYDFGLIVGNYGKTGDALSL